MSNPLVSVIIPIYNIGELIRRTIRSVLDGTYQNIELLVLDDGSEDDSADFAEKEIGDDPRGTVIRCEHRGTSSTRNEGIKKSSGEWLMFVDHDDYIDEDRIEKQVIATKESGCRIIKCGIKMININGDTSFIKMYSPGVVDITTNTDYNIFDRSFVTNALYDAKLIKENNIQFLDCDMADDFMFNMLAVTYEGKLYNMGEAYTYYCKRKGSLSSAFEKKDQLCVSQDVMDRIQRIFKCQAEVINKLINHPNYQYTQKWIIGDLNRYKKYYLKNE